ncbi:hypothetical protein K501DRAFT_170622 [Backusella circina FSU 941]|nr:hypothetical protein K501DRAFT_202760 [Backusella circina FSU 941]KAI8889588.1 hypothetical protein K501DRAFT_170622 [Backusella circina FSU 941]
MPIEKTNSSQRPFHIRKSLRDLLHKPHQLKTRQYSLQLPSLPLHDAKTEEYVYDILYECQRGLLQFDPNPWCDADMRFTPMNIENYQLPDPTWEWVIYINI